MLKRPSVFLEGACCDSGLRVPGAVGRGPLRASDSVTHTPTGLDVLLNSDRALGPKVQGPNWRSGCRARVWCSGCSVGFGFMAVQGLGFRVQGLQAVHVHGPSIWLQGF